ncbi:MAG: hypothetical protein KAJ07_00935 [Planctomycetes bacterium]|nr:hypothetical protein [Planctomycetota bacterium]
MNKDQLEKYSSAITLSDMEIFVFPELMYSVVLANIMSPIIWKWREAECFKRLEGKSPYKKLMRLKQFIMDEYEFNLDLNTWGLTHQEQELKRFEHVVSPERIAESNALFGYTGDKYYFDVDIRRHFGLDKYDNDIIPYWKTETVEAMAAFRFKDGYDVGAGECVSLATLYAAAAFIVCGIPLEDIYMVLTPLHSQNFFDVQDGVLSNNRRIVTKTMWFNGTAISEKAQRALRNEQVTVVTHNTGFVHCLGDATIDKNAYDKFSGKLNEYLSTNVDSLIVANFLRFHSKYQKHFQFCNHHRGEARFVKAETMFHYEHGSNYRISDETFGKLFGDVSADDFSVSKHVDRLCVEQMMAYVRYEDIDIRKEADKKKLQGYLKAFVPETEDFLNELHGFVHLQARLPELKAGSKTGEAISISTEMSRGEIIEYIKSVRDKNTTADLALYAYRDMSVCDWEPFLKAAMERSPVSIEMAQDKSIGDVYKHLQSMTDNSIYDGKRLAQPDEVANFNTGDGVEKAFFLANVIKSRQPGGEIEIEVEGEKVTLTAEGRGFEFSSGKGFEKKIVI